MVTLELVHVPEGRSKSLGPFEFVQITYDEIRISPDGDFIAQMQDGYWKLYDDDSLWTDFIVS